MRYGEFVYAVIPDRNDSAEDWGKILDREVGISHLEHAINLISDTKSEMDVDVIIVLSPNDDVLALATELGAVAHMIPGFFDTDSMIRTFVTEPSVDIDPSTDPYIWVLDPYTLEFGELRQLSEIRNQY